MAKVCSSVSGDNSVGHGAAAFALIGIATLFSFLALTIGYHLPPERGEIGVVFPPWVDQKDAWSAVIDAGGLIGDSGRFPNIVVAVALDEDFARRVTERGALFVAAARGLCGAIEGVEE